MILRLIVAFARWTWGVSPAFVTADSVEWNFAMYLGAVIDVGVAIVLAVILVAVLDRKLNGR